MRVPPWHDPRQMLADVSPWDDWQFADSIAPVAATFIAAGHGKSRSRQHGRYPRDTPTPDALIDNHVGTYSSSSSAISTVRYHRIFEWAHALGTAMLTAGRTRFLKNPPDSLPPAHVLVATVEWFRSRYDRTPLQEDFGNGGLPPVAVVKEVFGGVSGLTVAVNAIAGS